MNPNLQKRLNSRKKTFVCAECDAILPTLGELLEHEDTHFIADSLAETDEKARIDAIKSKYMH